MKFTASRMLTRTMSLAVRARWLRPGEQVMLAAFGVFCFVYPFAIVLLSLDLMPFGMEWMSSLLLAMLGVSVWAWLWVNFGRVGLVLGAAIFALGVGLEYVGVATGLPFGEYSYTGVLTPELPGGVPLAIGFAWQLIVIGGLFTARWLLSGASQKNRIWLAVLVGALLAVGLDLLLEPVAYHVKEYWLWEGAAGGYYGVPWSNFVAWLAASLIMNYLVMLALRSQGAAKWRWLPVVLYAMNVVLFGIVNLAHGFWVAGVVGLALVLTLLVRSRKGDAKTSLFHS